MIQVEEVKSLVDVKMSEVDAFISGSAIVQIQNQETYDQVTDVAKAVRKKAKELEDVRTSIVKPINDSVKRINELFKRPIEKLELFESGLKKTCTAWLQKQEQLRLEEQRRRDEEARKERERIEAEARKQREKEEAARRAQEEAERKARESQNAEERKRLEAEAERRRREADKAAAAAETKEQIASTVVAPTVESPVVGARGMYTVDKYTAQVEDKKAFLAWVIQSGMLEYVEVNESMLSKEAQSTKGARQWPGIKVVKSLDSRMRVAA